MTAYGKPGGFRVALPEGWEVDEDEEPMAIYHPTGAGALQATVQRMGPLKPGERIDAGRFLRAFLKGTGVDLQGIEIRSFSERGLEGAACEYSGDAPEEGRLCWRMWMLTDNDRLVYLTYACREEERESERAAVDGIIASLELC